MEKMLLGSLIAFVFGMAGCGQPNGDEEYAESMAQEHRNDAPISNEGSETAPASEVVSEEVNYATVDGTAVNGYLSRPAASEGPIPGLIVIHEWWGLNDNIRAMTDRLAGEGYVALAVDLYGGQTAADPQGAQSLMQTAMANVPAAEENLRQAFSYLKEKAGATRIGTIGWCFGGGWSLNTALLLPDQVAATVIYYGRLTDDRDRLATLQMPILGFFGGADQSIPVDSVKTFQSTLDSLGKNVEIHIYEGAGHAFANPSGTTYQPEAAADAWQKTVTFLAEHLKG
jgi:carboxymethylenebutenolidase